MRVCGCLESGTRGKWGRLSVRAEEFTLGGLVLNSLLHEAIRGLKKGGTARARERQCDATDELKDLMSQRSICPIFASSHGGQGLGAGGGKAVT